MMRAALLAAAAAAVIAALFFARPHATPGPPMRDFEAYYAAGQTWNGGGDPYSLAIWRSERTLQGVDAKTYAPLPFISPPALLPLWSAVSRLPFDRANALWRAAIVASALALAVVLIRVLLLPWPAILPVAIAGLGFGPLTSAVALGQIALPACAFAALALLWKPAGVFAWVQPNLALATISQCGRRSGAAIFAAGAAAFAAACVAVAGVSGILHYAALLHEHGSAERFSAIQLTPASVAYGFGAQEASAIAIGVAVALAAAAIWLVAVRRIADDVARFCATCALLPLAMPFFHEHDLAIVFLPAVYFTLRCSRALWPLASAGALFCATDWLGLAQRPDGTLQTLLLVGAAGCALAALRSDLDARMLLAPLAVLLAIGCAAAFAHAAPAPVWPDAMHPVALHGGNIAPVWHAEQVATGLFARNPVWAALRVLSLLGCALLTYCGFRQGRAVVRQAHHDDNDFSRHPERVEGRTEPVEV
jgi:hypothetical protein